MMHNYKDIEYSLTKSARNTASIYIERDGSVSLLAPDSWNKDKIEKVLERKRSWIYRGLAEWEDLNAARVTREFVNGEGFLYLGRSYRLRIIEKQKHPLMLKEGYFYMRSDASEKPFETFKEFFRDKGQVKIKQRVDYYKNKMGLNPGNIRVMELQNRWASCSDNNNLSFIGDVSWLH